MRKILSSLVVAVMILFTACQKEEIKETPGNIPGMGNAVGELEVVPYEFNEDIEFVSAIGGFDEGSVAEQGEASLKSTTTANCNFGSGGKYVKVRMTIKNTNPTKWRSVFFPRGCVFKVNLKDYQHAILLDWAWPCIAPGATRTITLHLYCINKGKHSSDAQANFDIVGITKSPTMWLLLNRIALRKINWEHYHANIEVNKAGLKSSNEELAEYDEITKVLQDCVWAITNGTGLSEEQVKFIESLPKLEDDTYPKELDDKNIEAPYWFDEYTVK